MSPLYESAILVLVQFPQRIFGNRDHFPMVLASRSSFKRALLGVG